MLTIACVLWQGGDSQYHPLHVQRLQRQIAPFAPEHRFVCLTNAPHWERTDGIERIPLQENWPGWWSKLELFRPGLFTDRVLYLDLDVEIVGDLRPLIGYSSSFVAIKDFIYPTLNSSVMAFDPGAGSAAFSRAAVGEYRGDQDWITEALPGADTFPKNWCISYRGQAKQFGIPKETKVVIYHGSPKPWQVDK